MTNTLYSILKRVSLLMLVMVRLFVCIACINFSYISPPVFLVLLSFGAYVKKVLFKDMKFTLLHFFSLCWPQHVPVRIMSRSRMNMGFFFCCLFVCCFGGFFLSNYWFKRSWSAYIKGTLLYLILFLLSFGGGVKMRIEVTQKMTRTC